MSKIKLVDLTGKTIGDVDIPTAFAMEKPHTQAVFESVISENASRRQGTHSTLTKGEVRGGGKKPYAQKHTGNARQGSIRNPHYVGGGVVFGPKPTRNYKLKVNNKVNKLALRSALSEKIKSIALFILDDKVTMNKPNTKSLSTFLKALQINDKKVLFIFNNEKTEKLIKSACNISRVNAKLAKQVSTKDILHANFIVAQQSAIAAIAKVVA
ncbi:MAG: 50S ribosomal protein L4 [Mycoplasmataceae bacterium]|jgi:large subunit ribosomal protein L4|nr:50S ribosomal protein L4 [Mycoplasmataceae bacterium]